MFTRLIRIPYIAQLQLRRWITARYYCLTKLRGVVAGPAVAQKIPSPEKLLLVVGGLIGDSVMCAPVVEQAKRIWPGVRLTFLGQRHNCDLFSSSTYIDEFCETRAIPFSIRNQREVSSLRRWLASEKFDIAVILLGEDFAHLLAWAGIPVRVGPKGMSMESCMTHLYDCGTPRTWGPNQKLNSLRCLGYELDELMPQLPVSNESRLSARRKLMDLGLPAESPYSVIHPFGSEAPRWWPMDRVEELSRTLSDRLRLPGILVGGPEVRRQITFTPRGRVMDAVGSFTLQELMAVLEGCSVVVTTDSGPFHIAGALGKPAVGLFRACRPEHAYRYPHARIVFGKNDECERKCAWNRCRSHPCRQMMDISVAQVLEQAEKTLQNTPH